MNNNTRRSERLRRKRQSTPGLSQPGSYSLYGGGYVVESEASFLPPSPLSKSPTPKSHSRRLRYKDSPHRYAEDSPLPSHPASSPSDFARVQRRANAADNARTSLFDILGSAARRPVSNSWRIPDRHNGEERVVEEEEEPEHRFGPGPAQDQIQTQSYFRVPDVLWRYKSMLPILVLVLLFGLSLLAVVALEGIAYSRRLPYFERQQKVPVWHRIRDTCVAVTGVSFGRPSVQWRLGLGDMVKNIASKCYNVVAVSVRYLLRGSQPQRSLRDPDPDYISRTQLESEVLPKLLSEARRTAAEEAARVTRQLGPQPSSAGTQFSSFAEQYAADKGLPADYALLSVGGSVDASEPSLGWLYARFVRQYVEALVTEGAYTPLVPQRPKMALTPDVFPGNCWAFPGEKGSLTIRLARAVRPTSVTIEHTPQRSVFSTLSAPRRFRVFGVPLNASRAAVAEGEMIALGEFTFDMSEGKRHLQSFVLGDGERIEEMRAVKVEILSNHGAAHTSLYRVRVHGTEVEE